MAEQNSIKDKVLHFAKKRGLKDYASLSEFLTSHLSKLQIAIEEEEAKPEIACQCFPLEKLEVPNIEAGKKKKDARNRRRSVCQIRTISSSSSSDEEILIKEDEERGEEELTEEREDEEGGEEELTEEREEEEAEEVKSFEESKRPSMTEYRQSVQISSDEDDFDNFVKSVRIPQKKKQIISSDEEDSLHDFIVDDVETTEEVEAFKTPKSQRIPAFKTPKSQKIPAFKTPKSQRIPAFNTPKSQKIPAFKTATSQRIPAFKTPTSQKIPAFNTPKSQKIPAFKTPTSQRIPGFNTPKNQKIPAFKTPTSQRIPDFRTPKSHKTPHTPSILDQVKTPKTTADRSAAYKREYKQLRDTTAKELFVLFNQSVFDNKLPEDLPIIFNKRMTKTAGFCYYYVNSVTKVKSSKIELAEKICDSVERLRDTVIHELCHAAAWVINGVKCGHGPVWKYWANKAHKAHEDLPPISRCHQFDIECKYNFQCMNSWCNRSFGRHSKSLKQCPSCQGPLQLFGTDGVTPVKERKANKFALFVKAEFAKTKAENPDFKQAELMKLLGQKFSSLST